MRPRCVYDCSYYHYVRERWRRCRSCARVRDRQVALTANLSAQQVCAEPWVSSSLLRHVVFKTPGLATQMAYRWVAASANRLRIHDPKSSATQCSVTISRGYSGRPYRCIRPVNVGVAIPILKKRGRETRSRRSGFTYNLTGTSSNYQNGVDFDLDWTDRTI
jgi:hypothetical protein